VSNNAPQTPYSICRYIAVSLLQARLRTVKRRFRSFCSLDRCFANCLVLVHSPDCFRLLRSCRCCSSPFQREEWQLKRVRFSSVERVWRFSTFFRRTLTYSLIPSIESLRADQCKPSSLSIIPLRAPLTLIRVRNDFDIFVRVNTGTDQETKTRYSTESYTSPWCFSMESEDFFDLPEFSGKQSISPPSSILICAPSFARHEIWSSHLRFLYCKQSVKSVKVSSTTPADFEESQLTFSFFFLCSLPSRGLNLSNRQVVSALRSRVCRSSRLLLLLRGFESFAFHGRFGKRSS